VADAETSKQSNVSNVSNAKTDDATAVGSSTTPPNDNAPDKTAAATNTTDKAEDVSSAQSDVKSSTTESKEVKSQSTNADTTTTDTHASDCKCPTCVSRAEATAEARRIAALELERTHEAVAETMKKKGSSTAVDEKRVVVAGQRVRVPPWGEGKIVEVRAAIGSTAAMYVIDIGDGHLCYVPQQSSDIEFVGMSPAQSQQSIPPPVVGDRIRVPPWGEGRIVSVRDRVGTTVPMYEIDIGDGHLCYVPQQSKDIVIVRALEVKTDDTPAPPNIVVPSTPKASTASADAEATPTALTPSPKSQSAKKPEQPEKPRTFVCVYVCV